VAADQFPGTLFFMMVFDYFSDARISLAYHTPNLTGIGFPGQDFYYFS